MPPQSKPSSCGEDEQDTYMSKHACLNNFPRLHTESQLDASSSHQPPSYHTALYRSSRPSPHVSPKASSFSKVQSLQAVQAVAYPPTLSRQPVHQSRSSHASRSVQQRHDSRGDGRKDEVKGPLAVLPAAAVARAAGPVAGRRKKEVGRVNYRRPDKQVSKELDRGGELRTSRRRTKRGGERRDSEAERPTAVEGDEEVGALRREMKEIGVSVELRGDERESDPCGDWNENEDGRNSGELDKPSPSSPLSSHSTPFRISVNTDNIPHSVQPVQTPRKIHPTHKPHPSHSQQPYHSPHPSHSPHLFHSPHPSPHHSSRRSSAESSIPPPFTDSTTTPLSPLTTSKISLPSPHTAQPCSESPTTSFSPYATLPTHTAQTTLSSHTPHISPSLLSPHASTTPPTSLASHAALTSLTSELTEVMPAVVEALRQRNVAHAKRLFAIWEVFDSKRLDLQAAVAMSSDINRDLNSLHQVVKSAYSELQVAETELRDRAVR
eukprot:GHVN01073595.1.p1 GENE.GHVN01073595.1~~GHVN01073595.1.p1  ORF type:complete len:493 (+),score=153.02 GHVN01073595.1:239-1717(+)